MIFIKKIKYFAICFLGLALLSFYKMYPDENSTNSSSQNNVNQSNDSVLMPTFFEDFVIHNLGTVRQTQLLLAEIFAGQDYFFSTTKEQPFIVDCGSNIGVSILYFKSLFPQARIIGFEPFPAAFEVLKKNIAANQLSNVTVYNAALGDVDGSINFNPNSQTHIVTSVLKKCDDESKNITVPLIKLSDYINEVVDCLKVDVEGAESFIFKDLDDNKKFQFINKIIMEYHHNIVETNKLASLLTILEKNGYIYSLIINQEIGEFRNASDLGKQGQAFLIYATKK